MMVVFSTTKKKTTTMINRFGVKGNLITRICKACGGRPESRAGQVDSQTDRQSRQAGEQLQWSVAAICRVRRLEATCESRPADQVITMLS